LTPINVRAGFRVISSCAINPKSVTERVYPTYFREESITIRTHVSPELVSQPCGSSDPGTSDLVEGDEIVKTDHLIISTSNPHTFGKKNYIITFNIYFQLV